MSPFTQTPPERSAEMSISSRSGDINETQAYQEFEKTVNSIICKYPKLLLSKTDFPVSHFTSDYSIFNIVESSQL